MIEQTIAQHIGSLLGGRVYQEKTTGKQEPTSPFAIIRYIDSGDFEVLGGATLTEFVRLQIDVYESDTLSLANTARLVRDRMRQPIEDVQLVRLNRAFNLPDPDAQSYRRVMDYRVVYTVRTT